MRRIERKLVGEMPKDGHVHLPHEAGEADPLPLEYSELGDGKMYVAGESFRKAQKRATEGEFAPPASTEPEDSQGEFAADQDAGYEPESWVPHAPFDSADYLDGPAPLYFDDEPGGAVGDDV